MSSPENYYLYKVRRGLIIYDGMYINDFTLYTFDPTNIDHDNLSSREIHHAFELNGFKIMITRIIIY